MTPAVNLETLRLDAGAHASFEKGACVMEAVAYVNDEPFSDHPTCVSPVIGSFLRNWNDNLDDDTRQQLKPYIAQVIGTNTGKKDDETRAWLATDWLARECVPAFLRCAGLTEHAETLERLAAIDSTNRAKRAQKDIDAARDAAWDAAGDAARDAARDAAGAAAWDAAGSAARAAARAAAGSAAWDAAWDAAGAAAGAAAWDAARAAAGDALLPTVKLLQPSAFKLLDRMIAVGKEAA